MKKNTEEDFWNRVDKTGGAEKCWNWSGPRDHKGYGLHNYNNGTIAAHRYAYKVVNNKDLSGVFVYSICENRICCNPNHLYEKVKPKNDEEAFWKKVDTSHGDDACWQWLGVKIPAGYGQFRKHRERIPELAHRVAYEFFYKQTPRIVLHTCDFPSCVNPRHLKSGTHQDNSNDMVNKNRQALGEKNGLARLTEKDILQIREEYASKKTPQRRLAKTYGVTQATIYNIVLRKTWKHV